MPTITPGNNALALAQAQTAIQNAQAYNTSQTSNIVGNGQTITPQETGRVDISGGNAVGSKGLYNPKTIPVGVQQEINPTPFVTPTPNVQTVGGVTTTPVTPASTLPGVTQPTNIPGASLVTNKPTKLPVTKPVKPVSPTINTAITPEGFNAATQGMNTEQRTAYRKSLLPGGATPTTPNQATTLPATQAVTTVVEDFYGKATPEEKKSADSLMNIIDPTGGLSPAAQADIKNAFLSGDPAKLEQISQLYGLDAKKTADYISAYRTTRDASLQENFDREQQDIKTKQATQQYDTAIAEQVAKVKANANNMSIMQDTAGRLQSQNMADAIVQEMTNQQRILSNLQDSKAWALADIVSTAKYNHDVLANKYNDTMSQYDQALLNQIKNLSDTGLAKTAEGLMQAQSAIEKTQLAKLNLGNQYVASLKIASDLLKTQVEKKTPDKDQTALANDGFLHNKNGEIIYSSNGKPLVYNKSKEIKQIISDGKGGQIAIYTDGTHSQVYEGTPVSIDEVANYAKAIIASGSSGDSILKMLPENVQQQVIAYMGTQGKGIAEKPTWGIVGQHYDDNTGTMVNDYGWINPSSQTTTGGFKGQTTTTNTTPSQFIASQEGFRSTPYWDVNGWAIGYGQHSINGRPVQQNDTITPEEAQKDMNNRLANQKWQSLVTVPLSDAQKSALASFEWNLGSGIWTNGSGADQIIKSINEGDLSFAGEQMKKFNHTRDSQGNMVVNLGLTTRRNMESNLLQQKEQVTQQTDNFTDKQVEQFKEYGAKPPEEYKSLTQKRAYTDAYAQWRQENPSNLTKEERKIVSEARANLEQDPQYKSYRTIVNQEKDVSGIISRLKNSTDTAQDQQQLISGFAKILDPTSVVRDSEFEITRKYGQAGYQAQLQEIAQYFAGSGILSKEARESLANGLQKRYGSIRQEYNDQIETARQNIEFNLDRPVSIQDAEKMLQAKVAKEAKQVVYKDPDGTEYDRQGLIDEITQQIQSGKATPEQVKAWLKQNNITLQ